MSTRALKAVFLIAGATTLAAGAALWGWLGPEVFLRSLNALICG
jgi:hypothetical protein